MIKFFLWPFFLHNRKDTVTHKAFFDWMFNQIDFPRNVPFIVDREHSIVGNLLGHSVGTHQLFYCTIHIRKDVENWCRNHKPGKKMTAQITRQMHVLIGKNSVDVFNDTVNSMQSKWPANFKKYFFKHIRPAIIENLEKGQANSFAYIESKSTTSNPAESWHSMLQSEFSRLERTHMRVDQIATHLYITQLNFFDEVNQALDEEGGEYTFKPEFLKSAKKIDLEPFDSTAQDIMTEVKEKLLNLEKEDQVEGADNTVEKIFARAALDHDLIHYLGKPDCYMVQHPLHLRHLEF